MRKKIKSIEVFIFVWISLMILLVSTNWTSENAVYCVRATPAEGMDGNKSPAVLMPGEYVIQEENGNLIQLVVIPPFWNTWWFKTVSLLFVSVLLLPLVQAGNKLFHRGVDVNRVVTMDLTMDSLLEKYNISNREKEIVRLLLRGENQKSIEEKLFISFHTVKNHVYSIYRKLGIKNRVQLFNLFHGIQ